MITNVENKIEHLLFTVGFRPIRIRFKFFLFNSFTGQSTDEKKKELNRFEFSTYLTVGCVTMRFERFESIREPFVEFVSKEMGIVLIIEPELFANVEKFDEFG